MDEGRGQIIPYPAKFLHGERWKDEVDSVESKEKSKLMSGIEDLRYA
jgi:hypothetical protein